MNRLAAVVLKNLHRLPGYLGKLNRYARRPDRYSREEMYAHIQKIFAHVVKDGRVTLRVTGQEHIPQAGGLLLYGNHQGLFDVVALSQTCDRPLAAVFKKELANVPLLKQIIACTGSFSMDREDVRQSLTVIGQVTDQVKAGRAYVIFPEGTRSKQGNRMGPFHPGSFRAAIKGKCTVLPVAFVDCFQVLDQKGSAPLTAQIHYLQPIPPEEYAGMKAADLCVLVRERIQQALDTFTAES